MRWRWCGAACPLTHPWVMGGCCRCRVKVVHLQRLRRNLKEVSENCAFRPQQPGAMENGQAVREGDKAGGAVAGKRALFRSWRFGLKSEKGKPAGGGRKDAGVELLEGCGDCCRKSLDFSNPYDCLNDEEALYSQQQQGPSPSACGAAGPHSRLAEVGGECGEGAGRRAADFVGRRVEGDRDDSPSRTMYKAPSYVTMLRDDSEPLDFSITDGYLSVSASAVNSVHGSETAEECLAASIPLTVPAAKPAHIRAGATGRNLFAAWRRRREPPGKPAQSSKENDKSRQHCPARPQEPLEGVEEDDVDSEHDLASSPGWDSGISLDRGFFDHGTSTAQIRQGAMQQQALMRAASEDGFESTARWSQPECEAASKHNQARTRRYIDESDSLSSRRSDCASSRSSDERRVLPRVTFSPDVIPPEMDPTRPPIEVGNWNPAGVVEARRRRDATAVVEVCPSVHPGARDTQGTRDVCRENKRPNVPERGANQVSCSQSSELLHARIFENIDFIEEYLELYNFAS